MSVAELFQVTGKIAFVTGAGSGLGIEFAEALAEAGADIVVADIDEASAEKTAERIRALGRRALSVKVDVTDEGQVQASVAAAVSEFGTIDILINNAGIADPVPALLHEYDSANWHKVIDVDLNGIFYVAKAVLGVMVKQQRGKVINIASIWGIAGSSSIFPTPAYNAAKGATVNLTRELGLQYATQGIQVNAICPGFFRTNLANGAYEDENFVAAITEFTPMKRVADASELRGTVVFLSSPASDYMTGSMVVVDGGCLAK